MTFTDRQGTFGESVPRGWQAETRVDAEAAFDFFIASYRVKYDKAVGKLTKDRDVLLAFYDFPAEHWKHIRTTNPIESTFATVRHRTGKTKGCLSRKTGLAMAFKLMIPLGTLLRNTLSVSDPPLWIGGYPRRIGPGFGSGDTMEDGPRTC